MQVITLVQSEMRPLQAQCNKNQKQMSSSAILFLLTLQMCYFCMFHDRKSPHVRNGLKEHTMSLYFNVQNLHQKRSVTHKYAHQTSIISHYINAKNHWQTALHPSTLTSRTSCKTSSVMCLYAPIEHTPCHLNRDIRKILTRTRPTYYIQDLYNKRCARPSAKKHQQKIRGILLSIITLK